MGEEDNFTSKLRKFLQQHWREIFIVLLLVALVVSVIAYLRERNKNKKTGA
jgi:hypothetical protein